MEVEYIQILDGESNVEYFGYVVNVDKKAFYMDKEVALIWCDSEDGDTIYIEYE